MTLTARCASVGSNTLATEDGAPRSSGRLPQDRPGSSPSLSGDVATAREDLVTAITCAVLVLGLYLDGWNHINLQDNELGAFLTPWHGLLYFGLAVASSWVLLRARVRLSLRTVWASMPAGYQSGVLGIGLLSAAAPGDAVWHTVFGVETGVARVISPFHLVLFTGIAMLVATPLRSALVRFDPQTAPRPSLRQLLPAVISLGLLAATAAFITQFTSMYVSWPPEFSLLQPLASSATGDSAVMETLVRLAVAKVLVSTCVAVIPIVYAASRWPLPLGTATIVMGTVGLLTSLLNNLQHPVVLISALTGGLVADALIHFGRMLPGQAQRSAVLGAGTAAALWLSYFAAAAMFETLQWPRDVWSGATVLSMVLAGGSGAFLSGSSPVGYLSSAGSVGGGATSSGFAAAKVWVAAHASLTAVGGVAATATAVLAVYGATQMQTHRVADVAAPPLGRVAVRPAPDADRGPSTGHDHRKASRHVGAVLPTQAASGVAPSLAPSNPSLTGGPSAPPPEPSSEPSDEPSSQPTSEPTDHQSSPPTSPPSSPPPSSPPPSSPPPFDGDLGVTAQKTDNVGDLSGVTATVTGLPADSPGTLIGTLTATANGTSEFRPSGDEEGVCKPQVSDRNTTVWDCPITTDASPFAFLVDTAQGRDVTFVVSLIPPLSDPNPNDNSFGVQWG
jgi:hypothetical protein